MIEYNLADLNTKYGEKAQETQAGVEDSGWYVRALRIIYRRPFFFTGSLA